MRPNPALDLYRFWREVVRFHQEATVLNVRERCQNETDPETASTVFQNWNKSTAYAPLNYRMGLAVSGISARHLDAGLVPARIEEFEPVITLNVGGRWRTALMSLYPNGDFLLDDLPSTFYQVFPRWTFFATSYAAGRRVWLLPLADERIGQGWTRLAESDWKLRRPYVPNYAFIADQQYRLVMDGQQFWRFEPLPGARALATDAINNGYAQCERRYARHQKAAQVLTETQKREKLALYIPKRGRMTGFEAVDEFTQHMRVYPAPKPEEAHDGSNHLVASPVHR